MNIVWPLPVALECQLHSLHPIFCFPKHNKWILKLVCVHICPYIWRGCGGWRWRAGSSSSSVQTQHRSPVLGSAAHTSSVSVDSTENIDIIDSVDIAWRPGWGDDMLEWRDNSEDTWQGCSPLGQSSVNLQGHFHAPSAARRNTERQYADNGQQWSFIRQHVNTVQHFMLQYFRYII